MLIPSLGFAASVTPAKVQQAQSANQQILDCWNQMNRYLSGVYQVLNSGGVLVVQNSTSTVLIPVDVLNDAVDLSKYQSMKVCFQNAYSNFP